MSIFRFDLDQGEVAGAIIIDRDNQASFRSIITDNESRHFSPNFPISVAKCELNTWAWENLKVAGATFSISYASTLLVIGCKTSSTLHPILS